MKKLLYLLLVTPILFACSGKKQIEKSLQKGNYDQAFTKTLKKISKNNNSKDYNAYIDLLEKSYKNAVIEDLNSIDHLKKDGNTQHLEDIYNIYQGLIERQNVLNPYLPLYRNGKAVDFKLKNYNEAFTEARNALSYFWYEDATIRLKSNQKQDIRNAYDLLSRIEQIHPNYRNTRMFMDEAYERGRDYFIVTIENQTNQIIPRALEDDLLNFDTYGLDQFWQAYHAQKQPKLRYDYAMKLQLREILISPERIQEKQFRREKEIVDGWKYKLDASGNVMKDSLGNDIKIDKIVNLRADYTELNQFKSAEVVALVQYIDLNRNVLLDQFPINSGFIFEHLFAQVRGDKRALSAQELELTRNRAIPFPSNEQMVFDSGEDLKMKLKQIIKSYKIRR